MNIVHINMKILTEKTVRIFILEKCPYYVYLYMITAQIGHFNVMKVHQ